MNTAFGCTALSIEQVPIVDAAISGGNVTISGGTRMLQFPAAVLLFAATLTPFMGAKHTDAINGGKTPVADLLCAGLHLHPNDAC